MLWQTLKLFPHHLGIWGNQVKSTPGLPWNYQVLLTAGQFRWSSFIFNTGFFRLMIFAITESMNCEKSILLCSSAKCDPQRLMIGIFWRASEKFVKILGGLFLMLTSLSLNLKQFENGKKSRPEFLNFWIFSRDFQEIFMVFLEVFKQGIFKGF